MSFFTQGNFTATNEICRNIDCKVVFGSIPKALDGGKYIRNGPNPLKIVDNHWMDGHGHLHCISFDGQKATYSNDYVKTSLYNAEIAHGRDISVSLKTLLSGDLLQTAIAGMKFLFWATFYRVKYFSKANTSLLFHWNRLFALAENGCPIEVNAADLSTIGPCTFSDFGFMRNGFDGFTAHPKICPKTQELIVIGYDIFTKPYLRYSVLRDSKTIISRYPISVETPTMIHDFCITDNYSIVAVHSLTFDMYNKHKKGSLFFDKTRSVQWYMIPRYHGLDGKDLDILRFTSSPAGIMHFANAYEKGDDLIVYCCKSDNIDFETVKDSEFAYLYEYTFNKVTGSCTEVLLSDEKVDFPTVDNKVLGTIQCNDIYLAGAHSVPGDSTWSSVKFDSLIKVSLDPLSVHKVSLEKNIFCGEWVYAHGYLMSFAHDENVNQSFFLIVDAKDLDLLCKITMPHRIPYGFHGIYFNQDCI